MVGEEGWGREGGGEKGSRGLVGKKGEEESELRGGGKVGGGVWEVVGNKRGERYEECGKERGGSRGEKYEEFLRREEWRRKGK